jgi:hypothetical protein
MRVSEDDYQRLLHRLDTPAGRGHRQGAMGMPEMTHTQLQNQVREVCKLLGLLHFHTHDSRKSEAGFPDSSICHPDGGTLWLMELKSEDGIVMPDQRTWLHALARVTRVESGIVRPSGLDAFVQRLMQRP